MPASGVTIQLGFVEIAAIFTALMTVASAIVGALWVRIQKQDEWQRESDRNYYEALNRNTAAIMEMSRAVSGNTSILELYKEFTNRGQ